jgi:hypothetical protein
VVGLLAPLPVKNCWTIAEHAGDNGPGGMQDLIYRASWDDALVRARWFRKQPPPGSVTLGCDDSPCQLGSRSCAGTPTINGIISR